MKLFITLGTANGNNTKLTWFNSKFSDPLTEGVDAFTFDWSRDNNWLVPLVSLIAHTIKHVQLSKTVGTLLVPKWKSAIFWPLLLSPISGNFVKIIAEFIEYESPSRFFIKGSAENSVFNVGRFISNLLVLMLDARLSC